MTFTVQIDDDHAGCLLKMLLGINLDFLNCVGFTFAHAWIYLCSVIKVAVATICARFVSSTTMT